MAALPEWDMGEWLQPFDGQNLVSTGPSKSLQ